MCQYCVCVGSPIITETSGEFVDVIEGQNAVFQCDAVSEPVHITNWTLNGILLTTSDQYLVEGEDTVSSNLTVFNVSLSDEGEYLCSASNVHGNASASAVLRVQGRRVRGSCDHRPMRVQVVAPIM